MKMLLLSTGFAIVCNCVYLLYFVTSFSDLVEEGDKVGKTAIDKFGCLGESRYLVIIYW